MRFLTLPNLVFAAGLALEVWAVSRGVHSQIAGAGMVAYGVALVAAGYLR